MANALIRKTGVYAVGNFASKVATALIIPIYAWFVAPEELGYYDYLLALMTMISPLCYMALWEVILRFGIAETDPVRLDEMVSTALAMLLCSALFLVIATIILCRVFPDKIRFLLYLIVMIAVYGLAQIWQYSARSLRRSKLYAVSGIIAALLNLGLIIILVCIMGLQLEGLVVSYVLSQFAIVVLIESKARIVGRFALRRVNRALMGPYLRFSIPMAMNLLLGAFLAGFGRVFVMNTLGAEASGLYAFAMKFGAIITAIGSVFSMAVIEEGVLRAGKNEHEGFMDEVSNYTMLLLLSFALVALPLIRLFWPILAGSEYDASLAMVPAFLVYGAFLVEATVVGSVFNIVCKTHFSALSMFAGCGVCLLLSLALVASFGEVAVAWSTAFGALALLAVRYIFSRKFVEYRLHLGQYALLGFVYIVEVCLFILDWGEVSFIVYVVWLSFALMVFCPIAMKSIKGLSSIKDIS